MRASLLLLPLSLVFTGCMTYQYATISSNLPKDQDRVMVSEDDTVAISYSFGGNETPLTITVYNKTEKPFTVRWDRSSMIVNSLSIPMRENVGSLLASSEESLDYGSRRSTTSSGTIEGRIVGPQYESHVPPHSYVISSLDTMTLLSRNSLEQYSRERGDDLEGKEMPYEDSPIRFRTFLTFEQENGNGFIREQEFWVSRIEESTIRPRRHLGSKFPGDVYFNAKVNRTGTAILATTAGLYIGGIVVAGVVLTQWPD